MFDNEQVETEVLFSVKYHIDGRINTGVESYGRRFNWVLDGFPVTLCFPKFEFDMTDSSVPRELLITPAITGPHNEVWISVVEVRVLIKLSLPKNDLDKALLPEEKEGEDGEWLSEEYHSGLLNAFSQGEPVANKAVKQWLSHVKASTSHHWLGPQSRLPDIYGVQEIFHYNTGKKIYSNGIGKSHVVPTKEKFLTSTDFDQIESLLVKGTEPCIPEAFLGEAMYFLSGNEMDIRRSILFAAIACEVKIKTTIQAYASEDNSRVVSALLDTKSTIHILLSDICQAVTGRSLKREDVELWKNSEALSSARNRIVHEGALRPNDRNDYRSIVNCVPEIFKWLESLK